MTILMVLQCCSKCLKFGGNEILNVRIVQFTRHRFHEFFAEISLYIQNFGIIENWFNYWKLQFGNFNSL